jgi:hypothetical protein
MFDFFPDGRLDDWKAKGLEKSSILGILKRNALQLEDTSTSPGRWTIQRRPEGKRLGYFKEVVEIFQVRILRDRCEHASLRLFVKIRACNWRWFNRNGVTEGRLRIFSTG